MQDQTTFPPCPAWCKHEPHDWDSETPDGVPARGHDAAFDGENELRLMLGGYVAVSIGGYEIEGLPCVPSVALDTSVIPRLTAAEADLIGDMLQSAGRRLREIKDGAW